MYDARTHVVCHVSRPVLHLRNIRCTAKAINPPWWSYPRYHTQNLQHTYLWPSVHSPDGLGRSAQDSLVTFCRHCTKWFSYCHRRPPRFSFASYALGMLYSSDTEAKNAVWGGLMTAGAQAQGAIGVVISGRCRDIAEHRALKFPVFSRGHSTLGQSSFTQPAAVNIPLTISPQGPGAESFPAVTIEPRDWIVADEDGVVCVPRSLESQVIELATKGRQVDALCMDDIRAGRGVQNSFKLHRGK